jgi:hypothetical protein
VFDSSSRTSWTIDDILLDTNILLIYYEILTSLHINLPHLQLSISLIESKTKEGRHSMSEISQCDIDQPVCIRWFNIYRYNPLESGISIFHEYVCRFTVLWPSTCVRFFSNILDIPTYPSEIFLYNLDMA